jgi:hypothetical protein
MSGYDIFAWIALLILLASAIAVRVKLDDAEVARNLPAGAIGTAAIYTDYVKPTHIVRSVILRQLAILSCVNPF